MLGSTALWGKTCGSPVQPPVGARLRAITCHKCVKPQVRRKDGSSLLAASMHPSRASTSASASESSSVSSTSSAAPESSVGSVTPNATDPSSHPFAHAKGLLVVIPQDRVDVEEEAAFYDEFSQAAFGVRGMGPFGSVWVLMLNVLVVVVGFCAEV